ncbi:MAG: hypothetical protein WA001_04745 [Patescibacteria group bacterium]
MEHLSPADKLAALRLHRLIISTLGLPYTQVTTPKPTRANPHQSGVFAAVTPHASNKTQAA